MSPGLRAPRRHYEEREPSREKRPLDQRVSLWMPAVIVGGVGLIWVLAAGFPIWLVPVMAVFAVVVVQFLLRGMSWLVGEGTLGTSGSTTPYQRGYSEAETLAMRGKYTEAVAAYTDVIAGSPADPEPYLRIARIYKKELGSVDDAAFWYRRARREATVAPGQDLATSRELVELYLASDDPRRAIPELARIIERFRDTPEHAWAEGLLDELRAQGGS